MGSARGPYVFAMTDQMTPQAIAARIVHRFSEHDSGVCECVTFNECDATRLHEVEAALASALTEATEQRDEYKALAAVGTWHADCRPNRHKAAQELLKSQAVIDKLADRVSELEAKLTEAQHEREEAREEVSRYGVAFGFTSYNHPEVAARTILEAEWTTLRVRAEAAEQRAAEAEQARDRYVAAFKAERKCRREAEARVAASPRPQPSVPEKDV